MEPRDARAPPARLTRRIVVVALVVLPVMGALVARPQRYEVDGHSMGPALRPGDLVATGWWPFRDHWHRPGRFERWVVALPDGTAGLKRIVGLPGETVAVIDGDLHAGADAVLKPPAILAEVASPVGPRRGLGAGETAWSLPPRPILDDDPDEPDGPTRLLLPVRDAGFAGIVHVEAVGDARVRARVGPFAVTWRLESVGRHAV
ncbi:MAG: S26 family signal peptidase, partial [Planctomycetia bacterium]